MPFTKLRAPAPVSPPAGETRSGVASRLPRQSLQGVPQVPLVQQPRCLHNHQAQAGPTGHSLSRPCCPGRRKRGDSPELTFSEARKRRWRGATLPPAGRAGHRAPPAGAALVLRTRAPSAPRQRPGTPNGTTWTLFTQDFSKRLSFAGSFSLFTLVFPSAPRYVHLRFSLSVASLRTQHLVLSLHGLPSSLSFSCFWL